MAAVARRLLQPFTKFGGFNVVTIDPSVVKFSSFSPITAARTSRFDCRQISQLVKCNRNRPFLVDTLALVSRLEAQGIPTNQARAITAAMTNVLNDSFDYGNQLFVSKEELQEVEATQECNYSKIKSELQIALGYHFSSLQHENKKRRGEIEQIPTELQVVSENARGDIEKSGSELWNEIDIDRKIAGILSNLNVGKGHMQDRLANQTAEISKLEDKIDQAIRSCRTELEATETEVKNIMVTVFSISAVGFAILCFFV